MSDKARGRFASAPDKTSLSGLWLLAAAVGFGLLLLFAARWFWPLPLENSTPYLVFHDHSYTVEFDATNHTGKPLSRVLEIRTGLVARGMKIGYDVAGRRELSVALAPSETRHLRCEFPDNPALTPNLAEVVILK